METQNHIARKPLKTLKVIYNNDCAILDFLSDLQDRKIIKELQRFIDDSKVIPRCLLLKCPSDCLVVLILHNDPFGFNDKGNKLVMYADNTISDLIRYFKNQLVHTSEDAGEIYKALDDITRYLYFAWTNEQDDNTLVNFMG
jgi:hypothetical protein